MKMRFPLLARGTKRGGFTLIELAIVLAVTSLLAAGLWRMMSVGNAQLRDQAAADQQKDLITAVRGYLASSEGYEKLTANLNQANFTLPLRSSLSDDCAGFDGFCNFLPLGFNDATANSYGQTYAIQVRRHTHLESGNPVLDGYSFMIMTMGGEPIPDTSGGRISSMIGNDGGFVYAADVCGANKACGAYGTWDAAPEADYGFVAADVNAGQVASQTYIGTNSSLMTPWLARQDIPGDVVVNDIGEYNTVSPNVDISLGGNTLYGNGVGGTGGKIQMTMLDDTGDDALALDLVAHCTLTDITDTLCDPVAQFNGGVNVTGLLKASHLYAGQFVYETSDQRLKKDIKVIDGALEKMSKINGYSFFLKEGGDKRYGVIAQEVEPVFPELIHSMAQEYKTVDYLGLVGPIIAAVNELREENLKLKSQIEAQGKTIEELRASQKK